ncbi:MAG: 5'-methylthioadenosine/adenosylhomocysteine nucleosidase [Candidatus Zixiibacteriota bacterium]
MIGLISALEEEIALLKENLENERVVVHSGLEFRLGNLAGQEVVLLKSGVGKVNAAVATQVLIDRFRARAVVFTGLAGALVTHLRPRDVVISSAVVQYDIDLTVFGRRPGEIPDLNRMFDADSRLVHAVCDAFEISVAASGRDSRMLVGTIATGDTFVSDPEKIRWLQREFGAVATEMEGGAVGQVCHMNRVPFVIVRIISDSASK